MRRILGGLVGVVVLVGLMAFLPAGTGSAAPAKGGGGAVAAHWTPARQRAAIPRDLLLDARGLAYERAEGGAVVPHGHDRGQLYAAPSPKAKPTPAAKPGGGDKVGPTVTKLTPLPTTPVGASHTFQATVTDSAGVQSVSFTVLSPAGTTQTFTATRSGSTYSASISGFTTGTWQWRVTARDLVKPANTTTTPYTTFAVSTGTGGGTTIANAPWTAGGTVQTAAGRIFFEMPTNSSLSTWAGYVCSGTVARDATTGRSVIITAAHCVYDDVEKVFARNVLFIPNQDATTGTATDRNCTNDPLGCWTPSFGVVDVSWTTRRFPNNIPWDYAFYVVDDAGAHSGTAVANEALDVTAGDLEVKLTAPSATGYTHALGYSYSEDPSFMYCAQNLATESTYGDWWLGQCGLSGGSSGGPWLQPVTGGAGPIISVNSWGYTNQPGMAGPKLAGTSAGCLFGAARSQSLTSVTNRGIAVSC